MRVTLMTALLCVLLLSCSGSKGNPVVPAAQNQTSGESSITTGTTGERVTLAEYVLKIDLSEPRAWVEPAGGDRKGDLVYHENLTSNFFFYTTAEFQGGDGHKLGIMRCVRLTATLANWSGGDVYDVRWIFDRQGMDLWHMHFVSPSGYSDIIDGALNPYRTFKIDTPERIFPQMGIGVEHMLFMIGTDPEYDPEDPGSVVEIHTIIDAATEPNTEEPVGINMGADEENRVVIQLVPPPANAVQYYDIMDHQHSSWDNIFPFADTSDFETPPDVAFEWLDPLPLPDHSWRTLKATYDAQAQLNRGGLYEIPLRFRQNDLTGEESLTVPPMISDEIWQIQYAYQARDPQQLAGAQGFQHIRPVATSPRFIDIDDFGEGEEEECVAVYADQRVVVSSKDDDDAWTVQWQWWPDQFEDRRLYALGAPAFTDQNEDGHPDIVVGYAMIASVLGIGLTNFGEGRIYCLDAVNEEVIWSKDYADGDDWPGLGDIVASPIVVDLPGGDREDVVVMLDRPDEDQAHVEVLRWDGDNLSVIRSIVLEHPDEVRSEGVRSNGCLIDPDYTGGDVWLACISAGITPTRLDYDENYLYVYNISDDPPTSVASVEIPSVAGLSWPADVLDLDFVHIGLVSGDVDGDNAPDIIAARQGQLNIYEPTLGSHTVVQYATIDADQNLNQHTTLGSILGTGACRNTGSLPALGDMNHDGIADIVFGLHSWVVALMWNTEDALPGGDAFDSIWTYQSQNGGFRSHPALADMTRDGFLDVTIGAGAGGGTEGFTLIGLDGSPANNHQFGLETRRRLWRCQPYPQYRAIGEGPAVANITGTDGTTLAAACVWSQFFGNTMSAWAVVDTHYEGHGVKEDYPPPTAWPYYLCDRYNSACYEYGS